MRIAVISDTHGRVNRCIYALEKLGAPDAIIHLGDTYDDAEDIAACFERIPMYAVNGNCGLSFRADTDRLIELSGMRIFITHGHMYDVKRTLAPLAAKVLEMNADLGLFGHTHLCFHNTVDSARLFNPGSASRPARGDCTLGIIEIENEKFKSFDWLIID